MSKHWLGQRRLQQPVAIRWASLQDLRNINKKETFGGLAAAATEVATKRTDIQRLAPKEKKHLLAERNHLESSNIRMIIINFFFFI